MGGVGGGGGPAWPDDVQPWLGGLPAPGAPGSPFDAAAGARVVAAVRTAYAAGRPAGRQEVRAAVRRILRDQVSAALTAVLAFLDLTQATLRPARRAPARLQAAVRRLRDVASDEPRALRGGSRSA